MATAPQIANLDRIIDATAAAAQTDFVIPWPVIADSEAAAVSDLVVEVNNTLVSSDDLGFVGNIIPGLSGIWNGGTLKLENPCAEGDRVIIYSARAPRRTGSFLEGKSLPFSVLDLLMDDFAIQLRDQYLNSRRALTISAEEYANGTDGFLSITKAQLEALASYVGLSGVISGSLGAIPSTAALMNLFGAPILLTDKTAFLTAGRSSAGDGGGALFYYDAADTTTADNGGTVRVDGQGRRFKAANSKTVNALLFGTDDLGAAVSAAVDAALAGTGMHIVVPPGGDYTWVNQVSITIPGSLQHKILLDFRGATMVAPADGYGLEITKTGPDPGYGQKNPYILGGLWKGNATANGAIHLIDCTNAEVSGVEGDGFTSLPGGAPSAEMGCVVRQTVDAIQCELSSFDRIAGVNCAALMVFDRSADAVSGGKDSHLRTTIRDPFFANGSGPAAGTWFYFGEGVNFGNCEISQIEGNWVSESMFFLDTDAKMSGTRIVGINAEANSPIHNKGLFLLKDYPNSGGISRPKVSGIGPQILGAGSGVTYPVWMKLDFTEVLPEPALLQPCDMYGAQIVGPTVRTGRYTNPNGIGDPDSVPGRDATVAISLTPGAAAVAINPPGIEDGGILGGAVQVRAWGKNGQAALVSNACKAAVSEAATITNAVSVADTTGRSLSLSWTGTGALSIALSGTGDPVVYTVDISGVFK